MIYVNLAADHILYRRHGAEVIDWKRPTANQDAEDDELLKNSEAAKHEALQRKNTVVSYSSTDS